MENEDSEAADYDLTEISTGRGGRGDSESRTRGTGVQLIEMMMVFLEIKEEIMKLKQIKHIMIKLVMI